MRRLEQPPVRPDGLQLNENRSYQEKQWTAERCAWIAFLAITLAALLGVTGTGGIFSRSLSTLEGGQVDHPRITRWDAPDEMTVRLDDGAGERTLLLSNGFAQSFQIESIQPQPLRVEAVPDGQLLRFASTRGPVQIVIYLQSRSPGIARFRTSIDGGAPQDLATLILP
jgi:hypothetical protein